MPSRFRARLRRQAAKLARLPGVLKDNDALMHEVVHPYLLRHADRQFATAGAWGGAPWDKYTTEPKYRKMIQAVRGDLKVLSGRPGDEPLRESFTRPADPNHLFEVDRHGLRFGSRLGYVPALEAGRRNFFGEPARPRPIMTMTPRQRDELLRLVGRAKLHQVREVLR